MRLLRLRLPKVNGLRGEVRAWYRSYSLRNWCEISMSSSPAPSIPIARRLGLRTRVLPRVGAGAVGIDAEVFAEVDADALDAVVACD